MNTGRLSRSNITISVGPDEAEFTGFRVEGDIIHITGVSFPHDGIVEVCLNNMQDSPDYEYCPPNTGYCCYSFVLSILPQLFYLPDTIVPPCDTILIPLLAGDFTPTPINSAAFTFSFDTSVAIPIGIVLTGSLIESWRIDSTTLDIENGRLSIGLSGSSALTRHESDTVLFIRCYVPCKAFGGDYCLLGISDCELNTGFPRAETRDGFLVVDWRWTEWICELRLNRTDAPGPDLFLAIGGESRGSDMYDPALDLIILPIVPEQVRAYLLLNDPDYFYITQLRRDIRNLRPPTRWIIPTMGEENGVIRWNRGRLPEGKFYMNSLVDMKLDSVFYYGLDDTLFIDWIAPPVGADTACFSPGWNLISLPVVPPRYPSSHVFSFSPAPLFRYLPFERTYSSTGIMERGEGYWLYSPIDTCIKFGGVVLNSYNRQLFRGWNIIGGLSVPTDIDDVCTDPPGAILSGSIFEYIPSVGYRAVDELLPGKGYWLMALNNAVLSVPSDGMYCKAYPGLSDIDKRWFLSLDGFVLEIGLDEFSETGIDAKDFVLPPLSPDNINAESSPFFLERDGYRLLKDVSNQPFWQLNASKSFDISVSTQVEGFRLLISDENGNIVNTEGSNFIKAGIYKLSLVKTEPSSLFISSVSPNPFNSKVAISISNPKGSPLRADFYDISGRIIDQMFSEKSVNQWDLRWEPNIEVSSGVYFVVVRSGKESLTSRLIYIK